MKRTILLLLFFIGSQWVNSQELTPAFKDGEWLKFRLHYSFLNASYATLHLTKKNMGGRDLFHVVANGKTTGFASIFFKVDDTYQTYFTPKDITPIKFKREVNEGGYTMDLEVDFDHKKQTAVLWDKKKDTLYNFKIKKGVQDIVSAFYYLRNKVSLSDLKVGDFTVISMLFDDDGVFPFKLEYLGKEVLNTKFGKVSCLKFRPYVQSGRVFEAQESITLWVSNDDNKIPIRIKADIAVGSIKADLDGYNGLRNQFKIIMD
ncbi:MAG: DUF3108 domain-containing protein [Flavobacteriaceae bacterium]